MSEDESTALEQKVEAQLAAEREAFEARFPAEAFTGIAKALKVRPKPENLSRLRDWLLPDFYHYLDVRHLLKAPTRKQEIDYLKKICEAATTLHSLLTSFHPLVEPLHWRARDEGAVGVTDHFEATLQFLAATAAGDIEKLASEKPRRGRPSKNEPFRQLTPTLIRTYESIRKEPAESPYHLPDSRIYDSKGSFHSFALAVWHCLKDNLPREARAVMPSNEGGLGEELKKHWPKDRLKR
jgi:hypothetical protein